VVARALALVHGAAEGWIQPGGVLKRGLWQESAVAATVQPSHIHALSIWRSSSAPALKAQGFGPFLPPAAQGLAVAECVVA